MGHPIMHGKIASEPWEFEQIHALNHETFTGEIPQHPSSPSGRLLDRFHDDNVSTSAAAIGLDLERQGFRLNVNSQYLLERNWIQICLMGETSRDRLASVSNALLQLCSRVPAGA